jgi:predicted ATPase/DNA-binding NarL/FixJ family response regulator
MPVMLTPIVGRDRELRSLHDILATPRLRMVTITGSAGVGKTRLALGAVETLGGEVAFIQLAPVQHARMVWPAIGQAFGLLADVASGYEEQVLSTLRGREVMLVLDNCEQIADIREPIERLLGDVDGLRILATSQAPTGVPGEQLFPLEPLAIPPEDTDSVEEIERSDAVALFLNRARAVNPNLLINETTASAIGRICRSLDGLPLAIELAAARTNVLSPQALLTRLDNRLEVLGGERPGVPDRQRTMRHAIDWSYSLLADDEQWLLRRLSVFQDRFSLESVEAIFERKESSRSVIDILGTLVDRSLVRRSALPSRDDRYFLFQTIRDYCREQLDVLGETDAAWLAHADVMVRLAEAAEPHLVMPDQDLWLDRLDADRGNIRAAVEWSLANGHEEKVFRIAGAIWRFCSARGMITECRSWLDQAFSAQGNHLTQHRTKALIGAGYLAEDQRDLDAAQRLFTQARHLAAAIGDARSECGALIGLGTVELDRSAYEPAQRTLHEALNMARSIGDARMIAVPLANLGTVSYYLGRADDAIRYWEESQGYLTEVGDTTALALGASNLGALLSTIGEHARAETYHLRALKLQRQMNVQRDLPFTLINLCETALALGDYTLAHDCISEAISRLQELGSSELLGIAFNGRARLAFVEGHDAEAAAFVLQSMDYLVDIENRLPVIENAELLGELCARRRMYALAIELLHAAALLRQHVGAMTYAPRREAVEAVEQEARAALDPRACQEAIDAGEAAAGESLARRISTIAREIIGRRHEVTAPVIPAGQNGSADMSHNLTPREVEVLTLLAQGSSTAQIADQLFVSPRTAATHINNILGKLGVNSRTAAVAHAMRIGLV